MTVTSAPRRAEISASFPSGVNFSRFALLTSGASVLRYLLARHIDDGDSSLPGIGHPISLPSGETSNPSEPLPTRITVSFQSALGAPGGPPGPGRPPTVFSMTLTVPELTLVVTISFISGET